MKILKRIFFFVLTLLLLLVLAVTVTIYAYRTSYLKTVRTERLKADLPVQPGKYIRLVDPFIGTGGFPTYTAADNYPGPSMPFGMVRLSPDTDFFLRNRYFNFSSVPVIGYLSPDVNPVSTAGYYYGDKRILGFSHSRLAGTGAWDGSYFRVIPMTGSAAFENYSAGESLRFSHRHEVAIPGYYSVEINNREIVAELTATQRAGVHRYTFKNANEPHILLDLGTVLKGKTEECEVKISPEKQEISGSMRAFGSFSGRYGGIKVYFVARFDQPFESFASWSDGKYAENEMEASGDKAGVDLRFTSKAAENVINLKLAISYVSIENARQNLEVETAGKDFEEIAEMAAEAWEQELELIRIEGGTKAQQRSFYTALYRTLQMPTVFNDVNGEYIGFDKMIHKAEGFRYFTDLSLWDTFRSAHPLYSLIKRRDQRDMVISLVKMSQHGGGKLPRWPSGHGYTGSMLGASADIVISEAYQKGITDFDVETAYQAMKNVALDKEFPNCDFNARRGVTEYLKYDYCPAELMDQAVSRTLEYAYADDAISKLAQQLGYEEDANLFKKHAQFYRNTWNPETQYFHPRNSDGEFVEAFDPLKLTYFDFTEKYTNDYVEGSALQWRWAVFFDPEGLISLFESQEYFVNELNDFFALSDSTLGKWTPGSYYWHGNEPDIHAAYLFNSAGRPDLTQKWVRWILNNKYNDTYRGVEGDDDAGTLSSWYVFSSLGFYPVAGSDIYQLGAPLFKSAEINMGTGTLKISTKNYAPENMYANKIWLNGELLDRSWFTHGEIANGGELIFEMSHQPDN